MKYTKNVDYTQHYYIKKKVGTKKQRAKTSPTKDAPIIKASSGDHISEIKKFKESDLRGKKKVVIGGTGIFVKKGMRWYQNDNIVPLKTLVQEMNHAKDVKYS